MKTKPILWIAVAAGLAGIANAEEKKPNHDRGNRVDRPLPPEMIEKFDKDGDGKLSEDERAAAKEAMRERHEKWMIERFDKDGDGKLSQEEREAMEAERKAKHEELKQEMLKKYDQDGDGKLSEAEKEQMRKEMRNHPNRPGGPGPKGDGEHRKKPEGGGDKEAPDVLGE